MARRLALLVNPVAGRGRQLGLVDDVRGRLSAGGFDVDVLSGADAAESAALAQRAVDDEYDALVAMGGDGLTHLALQAAAGSETVLGLIGIGTGNDTARALGLPLRRPLDAASVIVARHTRAIDVGRAAGTAYASILASGFDSRVNERANAMRRPRGPVKYHLATLAELRVFKPIDYRLELDGETLECQAMLVAVGNGASYGGGLQMCAGAELDDGLLDVVVIKPVSVPELIRVYGKLFHGTHVTHPAFERHRVRSVRLSAPGVVAYADGERLGELPLDVTVEPGAVRVFAPAP